MINLSGKQMVEIPSLGKVIDIVRSTAQAHLLPAFGQVSRQYKVDNSIVTEADFKMQSVLKDALSQQWPDSDFLAEEMSSQEQEKQMQSQKGLWIVDPIDGTSNFSSGVPYFAVSVAFHIDRAVHLAVVYDVMRDEMFATTLNGKVTLNGESLIQNESPVDLAKSIALIDFKRLEQELSMRLVAERPYASQRSFGSVALDWCWLAANRCHVYLQGRQNIWDYAAGELIFRNAGGHSMTLLGDAVFDSSVLPRSAVAALDKKLFDGWVKYLDLPIK